MVELLVSVSPQRVITVEAAVTLSKETGLSLSEELKRTSSKNLSLITIYTRTTKRLKV